MFRALAVLLITTAPALAWEARSGDICELIHDGSTASVRVTYDPTIREYAITITPRRAWTNGSIFAMRFDGPRGIVITTDRHVVSDGGGALTVTDSGFGNVLNRLEFNHTAIALLGNRAVALSLEDAGPAVRSFRAYASTLSV